ncbi:hypothetical protein [uncultured Thiodictyon sp.]|uniref:hypothetical protein n=1 Tax=uncultured Thiodictyon sp. TaxID=1846217 RepID=UPI0025FA0B0C|nr:hypothetical protein [uncultured Thiodictyon sp.]
MSAEAFVDTNIWVYAHTVQADDIRGPLARVLVDDGRRFVISTQILSEYYSAMLKSRAADALIQDNIEAMILRVQGFQPGRFHGLGHNPGHRANREVCRWPP